MTKQYKITIIATIVVFLLGLLTVYFAFINDETYVSLRMWLAEKQMEKEHYEKAEELYRKVIDRDYRQLDAYLAIAGIYNKDERYANTIVLLKKAYDTNGETELVVPELTAAFNKRAEQLIAQSDPKQAIDLLENAQERYVTAESVRDMLSQAYLGRAQQIKEAGELENALSFLTKPDPEKVDYEVFRQFRIDGFTELGGQALIEDDKTTAKQYYSMVLLLDPDNAEVKAIMDRLSEDGKEEITSFSVNGYGEGTITAVVFGGFRVDVPIDMEYYIHYDGNDPEKAQLHYLVHAKTELMGRTEEIYREGCYIQEEDILESYQRSSGNAAFSYSERSGDLSAAAEGAFTRYEQLAHEGSTDENSVNYNFGLCMIKRDHKSGKDYLPLFDGADLGEYESMLRALDVASVRYILLDGDHVTHVEADLSGSDATQLLAMAKEELSGIDAEMSLSSLKIHFDISGWNAVRLNLMQDVIGDKVIY